MPAQVIEKRDFTFVGGLNTEAGYLTFPANMWVEGDNLIPDVDGSLSRRVKIDYEASKTNSSAISNSEKETKAFSIHSWESVGGVGTRNFVIVQQGHTIHFYDAAYSSLSSNKKSFTINLQTYKALGSANILGTQPISTAYGNGKLIITSTDTDPILVTYTPSSDTISVTRLTLKIRDFAGVDDGYDVDEHPTTNSITHGYNLLNQGWDTTKITAYYTSQAEYPSNAQIWTSGKDSVDDFDVSLLLKQDFGSSFAPRGRFILDLFRRDRTTVSGSGVIAVETEAQRPTTVAFWAGRAWYAGVQSTTIGSWVMFSRVVTDDTKYEQCYQEADPTSEFISDLIPSDGGVLIIPELGNVVKMVALQEALLIFASNGIWQISGDSASGFRADGYQVKRISSFGCSSGASVIEFENTSAYWSPSGIFILSKDQQSGDFIPQPISLTSIQGMYSDITQLSKKYSQGFYDPEKKKLIWLYQNSPDSTDVTDMYKKDKFLIYDMQLKAFYTYTIPSLAADSPLLLCGILSYNPGSSSSDYTVIDSNEDTVITSGSDVVIASLITGNNNAKVAKYLTAYPVGTGDQWYFSFSDFENTLNTPSKFMDWYTANGVGVETATMPYIITGYNVLGSGSHYLQVPYILTYMKKTETAVNTNLSGCMLQGHWEWTNTTASNRWTTAEEIYRRPNFWVPPQTAPAPYLDGYAVVVAKKKMRGKGRALGLKFYAESGKDMQLLGWAIQFVKRSNV